jgi:hypothetical protein
MQICLVIELVRVQTNFTMNRAEPKRVRPQISTTGWSQHTSKLNPNFTMNIGRCSGNVPLAGNGAIVITDPCPAVPLGHVSRRSGRGTAGDQLRYRGSRRSMAGAAQDRSQSLENMSTSDQTVKRELSIRGHHSLNTSVANLSTAMRLSRSSWIST